VLVAHVGYSTLLTPKVLYYTTVIILVLKSLQMDFFNLMGNNSRSLLHSFLAHCSIS
jgi:hypothetical protein